MKHFHSPGRVSVRQSAHRKHGSHTEQFSHAVLGAGCIRVLSSASLHGSAQQLHVSKFPNPMVEKYFIGDMIILTLALKDGPRLAVLSGFSVCGWSASGAVRTKCTDCLGTLRMADVLMASASDATSRFVVDRQSQASIKSPLIP